MLFENVLSRCLIVIVTGESSHVSTHFKRLVKKKHQIEEEILFARYENRLDIYMISYLYPLVIFYFPKISLSLPVQTPKYKNGTKDFSKIAQAATFQLKSSRKFMEISFRTEMLAR